MSFQKQVRVFQALGIAGEPYDSSPYRAAPFVVSGAAPSAAVAAKGSITIASLPSEGDTITIAGNVITFVSGTASGGSECQIGATAAATATSLATQIGTTNTTTAALVTATAAGAIITLTAKTAGAAGNGITLEASNPTSLSVGQMQGGANASEKIGATFGRAFTYASAGTEPNAPYAPAPSAVMGGTGAFAGILVYPKANVNRLGLESAYYVPDGTPADLLSMGHVLVTVKDGATIGQVGIYNNTTGEVSAMNSGGSAPSGWTAIPGSKFVLKNAAAGELAILELVTL